jgi:hypothetical protein
LSRAAASAWPKGERVRVRRSRIVPRDAAEDEEIEVRRALEVEEGHPCDRDGGLEVDVGPVRPAADLGVVEEEEQHLAEGERHHDEVDAPACAG